MIPVKTSDLTIVAFPETPNIAALYSVYEQDSPICIKLTRDDALSYIAEHMDGMARQAIE